MTTHILQSYHPVSFSKYFIQRSYLSKELLTKEQTKVTAHILQSYHPVSFSKYLHPVLISIKIITNKRTDKSDHSHFAIISPSFFFKDFIQCSYIISIKELLTNKVAKVINHILPLYHPFQCISSSSSHVTIS